jgi:hypothetical protein
MSLSRLQRDKKDRLFSHPSPLLPCSGSAFAAVSSDGASPMVTRTRGSQKSEAIVLLRRGASWVDARVVGGTRLSALCFPLTDGLRVVALENLLSLGWVKVGVVKRMFCGLFKVWVGATAEGRGMVIGVAVGGTVEARCYRVVDAVSLVDGTLWSSPITNERARQLGMAMAMAVYIPAVSWPRCASCDPVAFSPNLGRSCCQCSVI